MTSHQHNTQKTKMSTTSKPEKSKSQSLSAWRALPPSIEEIQRQRLHEMAEYENDWKKHSAIRERESELRDMEHCHSFFCGVIEPREAVELMELRKRFRGRHSCFPPGQFWQMLLTAIADGVLLVKNNQRVLNQRRERVTMVAVNPNSFRTLQAKLAEFTQIKQPALTNSEPQKLAGN